MSSSHTHSRRAGASALARLSALTLLLAAPAGLGAAPSKDDWRLDPFHWRGELSESATVRVHNPFGDVRARRSTGDAVSVHAAKQRHRDDSREWTISISETESGLDVRVRLEEGTVPEVATEDWAPRRVDMTVYLPAYAKLEVEIVDGLIEAKGLGGDVAARSVDGEIVVIAAGNADLRSKRGRIRYAFGDPDWVGSARLTGGAGDIIVTLPAGADVGVAIRTRGEIATDLPSAAPRINDPSTGADDTSRFVLGDGRSPISIESKSGNVRVQQVPS